MAVEPTVPLSLRIDLPTREMVERQAEKEGSTLTDIVIRAIHHYVGRPVPASPYAE